MVSVLLNHYASFQAQDHIKVFFVFSGWNLPTSVKFSFMLLLHNKNVSFSTIIIKVFPYLHWKLKKNHLHCRAWSQKIKMNFLPEEKLVRHAYIYSFIQSFKDQHKINNMMIDCLNIKCAVSKNDFIGCCFISQMYQKHEEDNATLYKVEIRRT